MSAKIEPVDMYGKAPDEFAYTVGERLNEVIFALNEIVEAAATNRQHAKVETVKPCVHEFVVANGGIGFMYRTLECKLCGHQQIDDA